MRTDRGLRVAEWLLFRILHFSFYRVCASGWSQSGFHLDIQEQQTTGSAGNRGRFSFAPPRVPRAPRGRFNLNVQIEGAQLWNVLSGGARDHKESCRFSAGQLIRRAIPLYFIYVRVEKSVLGRNVPAPQRFLRRPQQFTEAIGVLFSGYILPGQIAVAIKAKKRISPLVLIRGKPDAELSVKLWTE